MAMAGEIARLVELVNVSTRSWSASFSTERAQPPKISGTVHLDISHGVRFFIDGTARLLDVEVEVGVAGHEKKGPGKPQFKMDADIVLRYKFQDELPDLSEQHYKHFAELNAFMNAWPYVRELVHSTTGRMGLPPLVLPLLKASILKKSSEKKAAAS